MKTQDIVHSILEELLDKVLGKEPSPIVLQASVEDNKDDSTEDLPSAAKDDHIPHIQSLRRQSRDGSVSSTVFGSLDRIDTLSDSEIDGSMKVSKTDTPGIHPLHTHILLYTQKYDAQRTLYALTCLKVNLDIFTKISCVCIVHNKYKQCNVTSHDETAESPCPSPKICIWEEFLSRSSE